VIATTDPIEFLRMHGPRTAKATAAACGLTIEDTYAELVHAESAGWARIKCRGPHVQLSDARSGAMYWEAVPVAPFVGAGQ